VIRISEADVFLYNGGEGEVWVDETMDAYDAPDQVVCRMMDYVDVLEEELVEGMEAEAGHDHDHEGHEEDSDEIEYDEHIWTSPVNAKRLAQAVCDALTKADPEGADYYAANLAAYEEELTELDAAFRQVVAEGKRDILVFGDRFPLLYFCKTYGLRYRAAFQGCSSDTEPSVKTLAYLIDKVNEEHIRVVYHLELSSEAITNVICESTGAKSLQFHSCHNLSREDFEQGATYLSLMWQNVEALKEGLA
jgi:zinc transport system substrate-binding protein